MPILITCSVFCQLSAEPQPGEAGVVTIALRTPDNKMHRRRFSVSDFVRVSSLTLSVAVLQGEINNNKIAF